MNAVDSFDDIENILSVFQEQIKVDYLGYKNHCIRLLNFLNYLHPINAQERKKLVIAAAFLDIHPLKPMPIIKF